MLFVESGCELRVGARSDRAPWFASTNISVRTSISSGRGSASGRRRSRATTRRGRHGVSSRCAGCACRTMGKRFAAESRQPDHQQERSYESIRGISQARSRLPAHGQVHAGSREQGHMEPHGRAMAALRRGLRPPVRGGKARAAPPQTRGTSGFQASELARRCVDAVLARLPRPHRGGRGGQRSPSPICANTARPSRP